MNPSPGLLMHYAPLTPVSGCPQIIAHQAPDIFALWQAWEAEGNAIRDVPYWALVWPAAQVLTQYIVDNQALVRGRSVLDCGCGGGVVIIAAAACGARRATGCDLDPVAVHVAGRNAAANSVAISTECRDVIEYCGAQTFDLILVADLFYQKEFSGGLLAALTAAHHRGSAVVIADSGRPFLPKEGLTEIHRQTVKTTVDVEGCTARGVRLYTLGAV